MGVGGVWGWGGREGALAVGVELNSVAVSLWGETGRVNGPCICLIWRRGCAEASHSVDWEWAMGE